jgi:cysteine synthase A
MLDQFRNRANPDVHRRTTAEEIWSDAGGEVDYFVSSVGTGGTLTGVASVLKARRPSVRVVAVEPAGAAILSGRPAGPHKIPGIGVGFIPEVLDRSLIDGIAVVGDEEAFEATRRLGRREGVIAGPSSGAALHAALAIAAREEARGKTIVVILPDSGERYITSSLFAA